MRLIDVNFSILGSIATLTLNCQPSFVPVNIVLLAVETGVQLARADHLTNRFLVASVH